MQGAGKTADDGHAWVVDGYDCMSRWKEYYRVDNGELYSSVGLGQSTYLHFNTGWKKTNQNTYYLCSGYNAGYKGYPEFSTFDYPNNNEIITGIE